MNKHILNRDFSLLLAMWGCLKSNFYYRNGRKVLIINIKNFAFLVISLCPLR